MENNQLNPDQSLALIQQMIAQTRQRVESNAGVPFLLFGYTTVLTALAVWSTVTLTHNYYWQFLWFIISAVAIIYWFYCNHKDHSNEAKTYMDRIVGYTWITLGIIGFTQSIIAMFFWTMPILYIIILLMGTGTALTGLFIRFRPLIIGGLISALVLAPLCQFTKGIDSVLIFAAVFVVMMVIPGHILNYRSKHPKA